MSVNKVILVGRLGRDPELRYTQKGTAIATWSMATEHRYKGADGEYVAQTQWHNVKVFGKQGENCDRYLEKGRQVYVEGRIETREYETSDGVKKWWTEVIASTVRFLGSREDAARPPGAAMPQEAQPVYDDASIPF